VENLLLIQNLGHAPSILGVMWTLPPELDMYLLLPFLFFFLRQNFLLWPLFLVWSVSAAYAFSLFPSNNSTFLVCIPYFLSGVISYVLFSKVRARLPAFLMPVLVAVLLCGFMVHPSWPMGWALTLTLGLALPFFRQIRAKWLIRCSHQMAKYSYGIYLAHPFCIAIGINLLHRYNLTIRIAAIVFSLALIVVITFHLLEKPMMDFGASLAARVEAPKAQPAILSQ
jgi:peptidoglycan/LPS O-acetylase OafA/YrhL